MSLDSTLLLTESGKDFYVIDVAAPHKKWKPQTVETSVEHNELAASRDRAARALAKQLDMEIRACRHLPVRLSLGDQSAEVVHTLERPLNIVGLHLTIGRDTVVWDLEGLRCFDHSLRGWWRRPHLELPRAHSVRRTCDRDGTRGSRRHGRCRPGVHRIRELIRRGLQSGKEQTRPGRRLDSSRARKRPLDGARGFASSRGFAEVAVIEAWLQRG